MSMLHLQTATSLAASAADILFRFTFNLELFGLSSDTTYDLYLYAVRSDRVGRRRLLPPEYPFIRIAYGSDRPGRIRPRHCPGGDGSWQGACTNTFSSSVKRSLLWRTFGISCVNSVSNRFPFLPIVVYIGSLYSLGCVNIVYYRYRCRGLSNLSRWRLIDATLSRGWSDWLAAIREARSTSY